MGSVIHILTGKASLFKYILERKTLASELKQIYFMIEYTIVRPSNSLICYS